MKLPAVGSSNNIPEMTPDGRRPTRPSGTTKMCEGCTVRARPGRLSAFSILYSKSSLYGIFVWVRRVLLTAQNGDIRPGQIKQPNFGLQAEGTRRWCAGCAKGQPLAVDLTNKRCEEQGC